MRKRRCFADNELDVVMLEHERAQALLTRRSTVPQQTILFPLPVTPSDLACRQLDEAAMRLIGLVRSWRTPLPSGVSQAAIQKTSPRCWPVAVGLSSKSGSDHGVDVDGTLMRSQLAKVHNLSLPYTGGSPSTLGSVSTLAPICHTTRDVRENQTSDAVVDHQQDQTLSWQGTNTGPGRLTITGTHRDYDQQHRHLESKSLRRTLDFSVESLLAK